MTSAGEDFPCFRTFFPELLALAFFPRRVLPSCWESAFHVLSPFKICSGGVNEKSDSMTTTCRSAFARSSGVQIMSGAELYSCS